MNICRSRFYLITVYQIKLISVNVIKRLPETICEDIFRRLFPKLRDSQIRWCLSVQAGISQSAFQWFSFSSQISRALWLENSLAQAWANGPPPTMALSKHSCHQGQSSFCNPGITTIRLRTMSGKMG